MARRLKRDVQIETGSKPAPIWCFLPRGPRWDGIDRTQISDPMVGVMLQVRPQADGAMVGEIVGAALVDADGKPARRLAVERFGPDAEPLIMGIDDDGNLLERVDDFVYTGEGGFEIFRMVGSKEAPFNRMEDHDAGALQWMVAERAMKGSGISPQSLIASKVSKVPGSPPPPPPQLKPAVQAAGPIFLATGNRNNSISTRPVIVSAILPHPPPDDLYKLINADAPDFGILETTELIHADTRAVAAARVHFRLREMAASMLLGWSPKRPDESTDKAAVDREQLDRTRKALELL